MCDHKNCNGVLDPEEEKAAVVDTNDAFPDYRLVDFDTVSIVALIQTKRLHVVQSDELATYHTCVVGYNRQCNEEFHDHKEYLLHLQ